VARASITSSKKAMGRPCHGFWNIICPTASPGMAVCVITCASPMSPTMRSCFQGKRFEAKGSGSRLPEARSPSNFFVQKLHSARPSPVQPEH